MHRLLLVAILRHERRIGRYVGQPVTVRVAVPSLNQRPGVHPFTAIARAMKAVDDTLQLVPARDATNARIVSSSQFQIVPNRSLRGHHVLILDDTWTTRSRTQSAALPLRAAGAEHVSVLVVSRYLRPGYGHNAEFIKKRLQRDYNPRICPVTGGDCPA